MKFTLLLLLFFSQTLPATHPRDQWLTFTQIDVDLTVAESAYQRIHPGYDRYVDVALLKQSWDDIRAHAKNNKGMRLADFYLQLSETLALMRCDHTKAELPKILADARDTIPVYLPFKWQYIENAVLVDYAIEKTGLQRGDRITHLDGVPIEQRLQSLLKYIPVDGFTDHTKMNLVASSAEHRGGALDHFGAMLWPTENIVEIRYEDLGGQSHKKLFERINYSQWKKLGPSRVRNFKDAIEFSYLDPNTAYLKIDTFVNYRTPVKPDKLFDPIFKQMKQQEVASLILDLRNNGGGSNEPPHRLLAHLMNKKFRPAKDVQVKTLNFDGLKQHLFTWEKRALNPKPSQFTKNQAGTYSFKPQVLDDTQWIKPDKTAFSGHLVVLTSRNNSSGSTNLLSTLQSRPNTTFIGEETGGSVEGPTAGVLFFLKLPSSGITTRIPIFRYYNDVDKFEPGLGIQPDTHVTTNKQDFINGVDTVLKTALFSAQKQ